MSVDNFLIVLPRKVGYVKNLSPKIIPDKVLGLGDMITLNRLGWWFERIMETCYPNYKQSYDEVI